MEFLKRKLKKFELIIAGALIANSVVLLVRSIIEPDPKSVANWVMIGFSFVCVVVAIVFFVVTSRVRREIAKTSKQ